MFRRDVFALVAVALIGAVLTVFIAIGQTPFFPQSLQATIGYCPPREFIPAHRRPVIDEFEADWFRSDLIGLHEQPIFQGEDGQRRTIRFTLLRSFHAPVVVRTVETEDGHLRLTGKLMPGRECTDKRGCLVDRVLTEAERETLVSTAAPLMRRASFGCDGSIDGSRWIVESSGSGDYRLWHQWTPEEGDLHALGLVMLDLTGWHFEELY